MRTIALVAAALLACIARAQPPAERVALLARGVNLSHWIWLPQAKDAAARGTFITIQELRDLKAAGITHVRLPFEPASVWDAQAHQFKPDGLSELRSAITLCQSAGLAVVVDAHPTDTPSPWAALDVHGACPELTLFWNALAKNLADTDPERTFLEILNEPHGTKDPAHWPAAQQRLLTIVREAAPHHTIILTGDDWGGIDGLKRLKPVADANVVYSFHFYDPHNFTHQGASWGWSPWKHMKGLPYPSTPELLDPIAAKIEGGEEEKRAAGATRQYGKEKWDAAKIRARIQEAAAWGRANNASIYCGEFGAYAAFSPRESRLAWLRDTAAALAESKIGWSMWDYTGGFALAPGKPGERKLDAGVAAAIGLKP
jgi:aryl-phospho-beta-D-glucosidase BglC (GH1 family)